ncbi:2-isopropylmalate synthase [Sulfuricella sp.]|uniref:2-isopropylmalate synthase n=1 Tax=Sulfuricella sp. TaxID=2099377 RepID=UPI002B62AD2F|nr:2-isopropylmalate synthase [Sulfuricella sp.]HUX63542.1 2-isopropylmalate synthase [Sulfuricella sp.]
MKTFPALKYKKFPPIQLPVRAWPNQVLEHSPIWCSVDLRDGNQALIHPLGVEEKLGFFRLLVDMGFKEIEIGFPSASETEYTFVRRLIEEGHIPDDVTVQVLVQSREHLIRRTFTALQGVKRAIVHLYNSTSELQRRVVFQKSHKEIIDIAVEGAKFIKEFAPTLEGGEVIYQYSPESFTGTELDFAVDICSAVCEVWQPTEKKKTIINLPATVEMSTPNIYADQIEWFCRNFPYRKQSIISIHTHNDRGTGVAAAELALMAGGERVEGTLFGNGERTGNVDLVTIALNLFSQGIDPALDFSNLIEISHMVARYNQIPIGLRHPYVGELVFTAFSGSHQDAIRKGLAAMRSNGSSLWEVPYLPIDPTDVGRHYEPLVRINSQSGKGGIAFVLEDQFGYKLPPKLQIDFSRVIQKICDADGRELGPEEIKHIFEVEYCRPAPFALKGHTTSYDLTTQNTCISASVICKGEPHMVEGTGSGPLSALVHGIGQQFGYHIAIHDYHEHAIGEGLDALAVAYVQGSIDGSPPTWGVGIHHSTEVATLQAVLNALNRSIEERKKNGRR